MGMDTSVKTKIVCWMSAMIDEAGPPDWFIAANMSQDRGMSRNPTTTVMMRMCLT